jgi:hypothetical protein
MFISEKPVNKTRKDHKCDGCLKIILKGSPCMTAAGTFEDHFFSYRICLVCDDFLKGHREYFVDGWHEGDIGHSRMEELERLGIK